MKTEFIKRTVCLLLGGFLLVLIGCNKDEVDPIDEGALTSASGKWMLISMKTTGGGLNQDWYQYLANCDKDNIHYFKSGGTFEYQSGATICAGGSGNVLYDGVWTMAGNDFTIQQTGESPETFEIVRLNSSTFEYKEVETDAGVEYTTTYTFKKQ